MRYRGITWLTQYPGTAAAALAGGATVAAYLNAKFHLNKDVSAIWSLKRSERALASARTYLLHFQVYSTGLMTIQLQMTKRTPGSSFSRP